MATNRNPGPVGGGALSSEFAGDPDMTELVQMFVDEMPQRVDAMLDCWEKGNLGDLRRMAHQLKGASGGYGFPTVGQMAAQLEAGLAAVGRTPDPDALDHLRSQVDELVGMCRRVTSEPPSGA